MKAEAETGVMHLQAKEHQGLLATTRSQKRQGGFSPGAFRDSMAPPTPWFWTCSLQNCQRINFSPSCCEPLTLWYFVMAALGNSYK